MVIEGDKNIQDGMVWYDSADMNGLRTNLLFSGYHFDAFEIRHDKRISEAFL
jgi:hypothetical protein